MAKKRIAKEWFILLIKTSGCSNKLLVPKILQSWCNRLMSWISNCLLLNFVCDFTSYTLRQQMTKNRMLVYRSHSTLFRRQMPSFKHPFIRFSLVKQIYQAAHICSLGPLFYNNFQRNSTSTGSQTIISSFLAH